MASKWIQACKTQTKRTFWSFLLRMIRIVEISARVGAQLIWLQVLTKPIKCCNSGVKDSDYSFKTQERRSEILSGSDGGQNPQSWFWSRNYLTIINLQKYHDPAVCVTLCVCQVSRTCASSLLSSSDCVGWAVTFALWLLFCVRVLMVCLSCSSAPCRHWPNICSRLADTYKHTHITSPSNIHTCRPALSGQFCVHFFSFCSVWNKIIKLL